MGAVYAANGQSRALIESFVIVRVVIAEKYAAVHETYVFVQTAMVFRANTHGTVAVIPKLHAAECEIARGRTLCRFARIETFYGYCVVVGADKGIQESALLTVHNVQPVGRSISGGENLNSLKLHVPAVIYYHLPNSRAVAMEQNALYVGTFAFVCLENHTGIVGVVINHAASVNFSAFVCTPKPYATVKHRTAGYVNLPAVVKHQHVPVFENLFQIMKAGTEVMQLQVLVAMVTF